VAWTSRFMTDRRHWNQRLNMKWIGQPAAELRPFEMFQCGRSVVGRSSHIVRIAWQ